MRALRARSPTCFANAATAEAGSRCCRTWGGASERIHAATADSYRPSDAVADLNTLAIECVADPGAPLIPRTPGIADELFEHDGQLTKREVRAITLAALGPVPGQLLWDIGAGCGSIGIEWMRAHPDCRAIAIEPDAGRVAMIAANAAALGTPGIEVANGRAPGVLEGLSAPDAVFVGGGNHRAGAARNLLGGAGARRATGGQRGVGRRRGRPRRLAADSRRQPGPHRHHPLRAAGTIPRLAPMMPVTQLAATRGAEERQR